MDKLVMEIKDCNSIHESKIEINKINVVGGVNGSGKSTVSRIFYSFLKANSVQRKDFIFKRIITMTNNLIASLNNGENEYNLPELTVNNSLSDITNTLNILFDISKDHKKIAVLKKDEFLKKLDIFKEKLINDGVDIEFLENKLEAINDDYFITHDIVSYLFEEYRFDHRYLNDYAELRTLWKSYQYYSGDVYENSLKIYSEIEEFLIKDDFTVNEKIFNRILLKEDISANYNKDFDLNLIIDEMNRMIDMLNFDPYSMGENNPIAKKIFNITNFDGKMFDLPNHLTNDDNFSDLIKTLNSLSEISKEYDKIANLKRKELKKELIAKFESIIKILISKNIDVTDIENALYSTNDDMYVDSQAFLHLIFEEYNLNLDYSDEYVELDALVDSYNFFNNHSDVNDRCAAIESVIHEFLDEDVLLQNDPTINELLLNGGYIKDLDNNISFHMNSDGCNPFNYFFKNIVNSVYYIDNVSIFDLNHRELFLTNQLFHMDELIGDIYEDTYTYELKEDFKTIMNKLDKMIEGRYNQESPYFVSDKKKDSLSFLKSRSKNVETSNTSTPSGVKHIGILELLLLNNKLKKDGYLIIDEPEVNLHPEWQFKFAEILVLLAKDLNITIYLNSHSPMFIESIDAFTEYYDMQDDVNYYLTVESGIKGKYKFNKIESDQLYKIYDNLGNAYDLIDQLRLKKHLGE